MAAHPWRGLLMWPGARSTSTRRLCAFLALAISETPTHTLFLSLFLTLSLSFSLTHARARSLSLSLIHTSTSSSFRSLSHYQFLTLSLRYVDNVNMWNSMFAVVDAAPIVLEAGQTAEFSFSISHRAGLWPNEYVHHLLLAPPDRNALRMRAGPPPPVVVSMRCPRPQPIHRLAIEQG